MQGCRGKLSGDCRSQTLSGVSVTAKYKGTWFREEVNYKVQSDEKVPQLS